MPWSWPILAGGSPLLNFQEFCEPTEAVWVAWSLSRCGICTLSGVPVVKRSQHVAGWISFLWQLRDVHDTPEQSVFLLSSLSGRFIFFHGFGYHMHSRVCACWCPGVDVSVIWPLQARALNSDKR